MADQLPASQTAPIDEFRILWTSQKKQKLKKWQDGFLRFHTYNKRMIVYDETRTLVCDMYLQRADKVNTGDEFEFEHHLVTVEEFKGRVIQDLSALISPIVERRQHRQLQVTHKQHPLYPERGVRLQAPAQDSPLSAQQAMHPPALPRQIGGVGNAEHVSLTEILKRSAGQERSSSTSIRTPVRRDASAALFRSGTTLATSGSDIRGEEIPTRSVTIMKPPVRAKQGSIRPIQPPEGILDMTPPLCCAQSTRNITTIAGHGTTTSRMRSTTFHHEASSIEGPPELPIENSNTSQFGSESWLDTPTTPQAPNVTAAGNDSPLPWGDSILHLHRLH
ncbi:hypothetical protein EV426DRAFT_298986 [Tirmania nivea]|nr:hypothetical protein EV426DRAFT_298986 [Tirmania nivea]